jgi:hypothetical protein
MVDAGFNVKAEEAMRKADKKIKGKAIISFGKCN